MVVALDAPVGVDGLKGVGDAVLVGVGDFGDFRALGEEEGSVFPEHAEGLVEVLGEFFPSDFAEVLAVSARADPKVATAGGDGDVLVGHEGDGADFHDFAGRKRDFLAEVKIGRRVAEGGSEEEGKENAHWEKVFSFRYSVFQVVKNWDLLPTIGDGDGLAGGEGGVRRWVDGERGVAADRNGDGGSGAGEGEFAHEAAGLGGPGLAEELAADLDGKGGISRRIELVAAEACLGG